MNFRRGIQIFFLICSFSFFKVEAESPLFDYGNTLALIVGVLEWEDEKNLEPFSKKGRKDLEFHHFLLDRGVHPDRIILLQDRRANLKAMFTAFKNLLQVASTKDTLLFYFAGHGLREGKKIYFANHDLICSNMEETGFPIDWLAREFSPKFPGKRIILAADCCHSGGLIEVAKQMHRENLSLVVFSSSAASNESTGNWTFTQTLLEGLRGQVEMDDNGDRVIHLGELNNEIMESMKFREHQIGGFYSTEDGAGIRVSEVVSQPQKQLSPPQTYPFQLGEYVFAFNRGEWKPARIIQFMGDKLLCKIFQYSDYQSVRVSATNLKKIHFPKHQVGSRVEALYEGKLYPAKIVAEANDFYQIHYDDFDDEWNEWVMYDRICTNRERRVQIEFEGEWYPGEVIEEGANRLFVRYDDYDFSWDEWVGPQRIRPGERGGKRKIKNRRPD